MNANLEESKDHPQQEKAGQLARHSENNVLTCSVAFIRVNLRLILHLYSGYQSLVPIARPLPRIVNLAGTHAHIFAGFYLQIDDVIAPIPLRLRLVITQYVLL